MNSTWHDLANEVFLRKEIKQNITVVIPTLGRPILAECLYWIASGDCWPAECLIVEQGSNPEIRDWVLKLSKFGLKFKHISSQKRGKSAGINSAFDLVNTQFVAVTDDDCFVNADWLCKMADALRQSPDAIITGRVDPAGDGEPDFCVVTSKTPKIYKRPQLKINPLIGGNMGVAMENVKRIGFFDEHPSIYYAAEDRDWGYRALRLGIPIIYNPEIILRHYSWRNANQRADRYSDYSRGQGAFFGKYLFSGDLLIPLQVSRALVRASFRWMRGKIKRDQDMIDRGRADMLHLIPGVLSGIRRSRQG
jgi:GT2 family glycosyltransferase